MPARARRDDREGKKAKAKSTSREQAPKTSSLTERKRSQRRAAATAAQREFLDDIRISLEEVQRGETIPADVALDLINQNLDDDQLDRRLDAAVRKAPQ